MTNPASAGGEAFDAMVELDDFDLGSYMAERDRRYRLRLAAEADAAVAKIEAQIEGLKQTLASRRADAEEYRASVAQAGA